MRPGKPFVMASLLLLAPRPCGAQTDAQRAEARQHFERALADIQQSSWPDAVTELEAARALTPTLPVMFNLGFAYRAVGRVTDAIGAFRGFLQMAGGELSPARQSEVEGYLRDLSAAQGHLTFELTPAHATVALDGRTLASDVTEVAVDPGTHTVVVTASEHLEASRSVTVERGARIPLRITLEAMPSTGHLRVECAAPGSRIRVDGHDVGTDRAALDLPPGTHPIEVRASGFQTFRDRVTLTRGARVSLRPELHRRPLYQEPFFWLATGAVAAVATTLVILLLPSPSPPVQPLWGVVSSSLRVSP